MFLPQQTTSNQTDNSSASTLCFDKLRTIHELDLKGKSVLLRADLDVLPVIPNNPDTRLTSIKKSIDYIFDRGAEKIVIIGHAGRPKTRDAALSTKQLIKPLQNILGRDISFSQDFDHTPNGKVIIFENVRFWSGETESPESNERTAFAKSLAEMGHVFINDAFGNCHRNHSSMVDIATILPSAIGLQIEKEMTIFEKMFQRPKEGFVAIIGGAKIETKLPVINKLAPLAEYVLVGGILPNEIKQKGLIFPNNVIIANMHQNVPDIDEASAEKFAQIINQAKTIVWNGPMGVFEKKVSSKGTDAVAYAIVKTTKTKNAFSVAGGGETEKYLRREKLLSTFTHISNGGGALLQFLSGKDLVALQPFKQKNNKLYTD